MITEQADNASAKSEAKRFMIYIYIKKKEVMVNERQRIGVRVSRTRGICEMHAVTHTRKHQSHIITNLYKYTST